MAKLMILGGSQCQKSAFIAAAKKGHETVLVDYLDHPPAAQFADVHEKISTFDVDGCTQAARRHRIDGIMTIGTDQPVYTAALVAQRLCLPSFISAETALAVTDKQVMKPLFAAHGIPTVRYRLINRNSSPGDLGGLNPPLVLKPVDSQGQRGVFKLPDGQSVFGRLAESLSFSRKEDALVEEYYPSDEITFSGWVQEGRLYPLSVTDRLHLNDPVHIGICTGHRFPTKHMDQYEKILTLSRRIVDAFGIQNGPVYFQMLIGEQGVVVNEIACRIGGAFEDIFIPYLSGFDILCAVIDGALGLKADVSPLSQYDPAKTSGRAYVALLFARPGRIASLTPLSRLRELPFVLDAGYNFECGQIIPPAQNATARFGHCVIAGEEETIGERVRALYDLFRVTGEDGRELALEAPAEFGIDAMSETEHREVHDCIRA